MPSVTKNFGDASFNLVAPTSAATGAITYVSSNTNVATISGSTISIIGAGTATITATQATDSNYLEATTSTTLTVNKSTPVLSNFNPISKTTDDGQFALIAPTSSGGTGLITYISSNPSVATISGNMVTITGSGSTLITATKESDTNFNAQSISAQLTVGVGITQTPVLTSPRNNTTGATTLQINYILPEAPLPGSVQLVFTPSTGGTPIVWVMNNLTSVSFAYPVGTNPTLLSNVVSGTALAFTTYNITISYQDVFASPTASSTNTNIQTLAPPSISLAQNNYGGVINKDLTPIVTINSGGLIESYTINPALPNGVTINSTTGVVSGRPSRASAVINYTITATNPAGSSNASFGLFIDEDTDGDGIGNLTDPDIDGDKIPNNPDADVNGDGIIDNGTDTDGDGINDANDPDIDGDGVPNTQEILDGTNPNVPGAKDTDGDGVPDYIETQQGTNPNIPGAKDSDGDGVPDYIEQLQGTNPNLSGDGLDTDGDGLPDYNEGYVFSNPKLSSDEDNNGILDYLQFNNHVSVDDDLEIFNSMTVNGDGLNDVFVIRGIDQYPNNTVTIYNRWGIEVYKEDGYGQDNKFFRGISEGRVTISQSAELPKGTYFYIVRYVNKEAVEKQRSGYLYITK
jgi:gliding motility-associated-like protein